jgi:hypothetical protein
MKLKRAALLAEIIGGLGIIISILYLAFEVSENSDSQVVANHLALTARMNGLNRSVLANNELADLIAMSRSNISSLTPGEVEQVRAYTGILMQIWEDALGMYDLGDLPDEYWVGWNRALCRMVSEPGWAAIWKGGLYDWYSDSFVTGTATRLFR